LVIKQLQKIDPTSTKNTKHTKRRRDERKMAERKMQDRNIFFSHIFLSRIQKAEFFATNSRDTNSRDAILIVEYCVVLMGGRPSWAAELGHPSLANYVCAQRLASRSIGYADAVQWQVVSGLWSVNTEN